MSAEHLNNPIPPSRRDVLQNAAMGFGSVALAALMQSETRAAKTAGSPYAPKPPHYAPKAKRVIQIFCPGGVSHIDTFDYKPDLAKHHGRELTNKGKIDPFFGKPGKIMRSPFAFKRHGQTGHWVSDLLPHTARHVDDIAFIHSMVADTNNHTPAAFQMNSGFTMNGFPSIGAWVSYGLGSLNENLPAFVVLPDPRGLPAGGSINWTAGFLPATHQGVAFRTKPGHDPITDLTTPSGITENQRHDATAFLQSLNRRFADANPQRDELAARIRSYELAAKMQLAVPEATDLAAEPDHVQQGRNCLMARRLVERGVRYVQVWNGGAFGKVDGVRINWDAHEDVIRNHPIQARTMDQPVAGLLADLKQRGMLEDTLLLWTTEFGRTPITQGVDTTGRDHHPFAFTCWMAGAGVRPGVSHGASDEVGYYASDDPVTIPDLHATVLHLLGIDHAELTYYHNGIDRRLTNVHGHPVGGVLA
ncbi:MAG: DUF1501 domain-containing protein [Planctomycetota bacterium]|jgi:hypothetical protein